MKDNVTIITGASSNHYGCVQSLLWTVARFEPGVRVIVWNLGLTEQEVATLTEVPPFYLKSWELRTFDFDKYPAYFRVTDNAGRMGFRPVSVKAAADEFGGVVAWMDAGCQLRARLNGLIDSTKKHGVFCAATSGIIGDRLFPSAREPLQVNDAIAKLPLRDAGVCAFDTAHTGVIELLNRWRDVALDARCTAPLKSFRGNHRQDAVFAALLASSGWDIPCNKTGEVILRTDWMPLKETQYQLGVR